MMVVAKAVGVVVVVTVVMMVVVFMVRVVAVTVVVVFVFVIVFVGVDVIVVVVVGMRGSHEGVVLSVVISCGCESVDDFTVCEGIGGVGHKGRDSVGGAGGEEVFFSADDHFQFAVEDKGNLFVRVAVFKQPAAFPDLPNGKGAFVAVH
jgi:hypothetical protein